MRDTDTPLKVIIVGNGGVGKTSLMTRYCKGVMTTEYKKTIGTDFCEKEIELESTGDTIKLMIWDTAGQEMFSRLTRSYYRGAGACIFVFSTTDRESFLEIEQWTKKVEEECGDGIIRVLVQNKIDLLDQAQVNASEVEQLAKKLQLKLYRICVKNNLLVDDVFKHLAERYISQDDLVDHCEAVAPVSRPPAAVPSNAPAEEVNASRANDREAEPKKVEFETSKGFQLHQPSTRRTKGKKQCCKV